MEVGHDHFGGGDPLLVMNADRDAAAVIRDGGRAVGVERDRDRVAIPGKRLVNRVVDDLIHHMVQPRPVIGIADIHPGPLTHGFKATQHLDRLLVVARVLTISSS